MNIHTFIIILLTILGSLAFIGSWGLIGDPSGKSIQIPIEVLEGTPFDNFLIPGFILLFAIGFLSFAVAIMTFKRSSHYPWFIVLQGCVLIGWLTAEILFNKELFYPAYHCPLYILGILLVIIGYMIHKKG